jgi:hypothetical protein
LLISGLILIFVIKKNILIFLNKPLDFGLKFNNKNIFGENKTFRGVIIYIVLTLIVSFILHIYARKWQQMIHPIFTYNPIILGCLYFSGYITGELINSFIKRQLNIKTGQLIKNNFKYLQYIFDLTDGIIIVGISLIYIYPKYSLDILIAFILALLFHFITDLIMVYLRLK